MSRDTAVVLLNPKTPYNVGSAIRACAVFGVTELRYTGKRIDTALANRASGTSTRKGTRLPREERMKEYEPVNWKRDDDALDQFIADGYTPVCVEVDGGVPLHDFTHPEKAVYVFGPEDGSVSKGIRHVCHHFVRIASPHRTPMNLAAAVNVVLYTRYVESH